MSLDGLILTMVQVKGTASRLGDFLGSNAATHIFKPNLAPALVNKLKAALMPEAMAMADDLNDILAFFDKAVADLEHFPEAIDAYLATRQERRAKALRALSDEDLARAGLVRKKAPKKQPA